MNIRRALLSFTLLGTIAADEPQMSMKPAVSQPSTVLTIDPSHRIIEGIATDGVDIWVSSVVDRQILVCRKICHTFAALAPGLHPFALAWDGTQQLLWIAADCPAGMPGIKPCDRGALVALNSRGRVVTHVAPSSGAFHPGDVSAAPTGIFVSDSQTGAVYKFARRGALLPVIASGVGKSGQGTALSADGRELIAADYAQGVARVDLATGSRTILMRADGKPLRGIDGMARCGSVYFGVYNGSTPGALLAIVPGERNLTLTQVAALPDPTQVAYDGMRLLVVADSGWATLDKPAYVRTSGTPIVAISLSADCRPL